MGTDADGPNTYQLTDETLEVSRENCIHFDRS